jgi:HlyD family secretion protein
MKRKVQTIPALLRRRPLLAGLAVVLVIFAVGLTLGLDRGAAKPDYRLAEVERGGLVSFVAASGTLGAVTTVQVGSQISGQVRALSADFNDSVTANQEIARIAPEIFEARREEAAALLAIAQANVKLRRAGIDRAAASLESARARLTAIQAQEAEAEASLNNAERVHERQAALFKRKITSSSKVDDARMAFDQSRARLKAARSSTVAEVSAVVGAQAGLSMAKAELATARAQILQRQAALNQAAVNLAHTYIRSPVSGRVIARNIDVGQTVAASLQAPVLFVIAADLSRMQVEVAVDEADIGAIQTGQSVKFAVDSFPRRDFTGKVRQVRLSPETVQNVVTYTVVVAVNNADRLLLPGMTANVEIAVLERNDVLKVPNRALRFKPPGAKGGGKSKRQRDPGRSARLIKSLTEKLKLDEKQQAALQGIFDDARETFKAMYQGGASREDLRGAFAKVRQEVQQSIPTILNPAQLEQYRRDVAARQANPVRPGRVWLMGEDGWPKAVDVRVGASDGDFSEIIKGEISETDEVIIAVEKTAKSGGGLFGLRF